MQKNRFNIKLFSIINGQVVICACSGKLNIIRKKTHIFFSKSYLFLVQKFQV